MRKMKDSGIPWIGIIPEEWTLKRGKFALRYLQKPVNEDDEVITCFRDGEVTLRRNRRELGFTMSDKEIGYQGIDVGDLVVHGMDGFAGSIGISDSRGKASPVLNVLDTSQNKRYVMYYLRSMAYNNVFLALATGIRVRSCDLRWNKLAELIYPFPSLQEQERIVSFIDRKVSDTNSLIVELQEQIDTLEQYRRSIITESITHGLNSKVRTKDSRVVWMGQIPSHWQVIKTKYLFEIVKRIAGEEGYDVLSVTQQGLKVKDLDDYGGQIAESYAGYQFVYPEDFVMNHMDLLTGWVDYSDKFGVTSPDYRVFRLIDKKANSLDYFKYVFQCCYLDKIYYSLGNGVAGVGRWRLQAHTFKNFRLPVPPLEEQMAIAKYLDEKCASIVQFIDTNKQKIAVLQDYKKSIIYEYVTGKKEVPV